MFSLNYAAEIFAEIKNSELVKYNDAAITSLNEEILYLDEEVSKLNTRVVNSNEIPDYISVNYALILKFKERNERLLQIYAFNRNMKIQDKILNKQNIDEALLSLDEIKFVEEFTSLIENSYLRNLELTNRNPPLDFYVQIVAKEDCGAVLTGDEFVEIKKDCIYFIRKNDIAHLLEKNMVEEIL